MLNNRAFCGTAAVLTMLFLAACSQESELGLHQSTSDSLTSYATEVKPILESRCVSCHACYDAPCQLKLASYEGAARGGSKDKVYEPTRLSEATTSRLYFDAHNTPDWRARGFHSVLGQSIETNERTSIDRYSTLLGLLDLKAKNAMPENARSLNIPIDDPSAWQCPSNQAEFISFVHDYPQRGMPYGLPELREEQQAILRAWVSAGAYDDSDYRLTSIETKWIARWEEYLNRDTLKARLVSRYIYEHLFLASLYGEQTEAGRYFQLVRSTTPPGETVNVIATRRPYDAPKVERVYYRLRLNREATVAKTHMPYALDERKRRLWTNWFFESNYQVTFLPGYDIQSASNPFKTFAQLPSASRYKFMLDEANFTVKGFIKGPVCKGPSAVNVINEHFWVFFLDPDYQGGEAMNNYLAGSKALLDLPAEKEDTLNLLGAWDEYATKEKAFLVERTKFNDAHLNDQGVFDLDLIWDGDGANANAALTVYRHYDNASVHQGLNGQAPKTAWVIDYPLLERIHYLLIAGYDVYGNVSHQLLSRIYMDFLRMEGESMFLTFLNQSDRKRLRKHWYRDADERIEDFMALTDVQYQTKSIISDNHNAPKLALYQKFTDHIGSALNRKYTLESIDDDDMKDQITRLHGQTSAGFMHLPEVSFIQVASREKETYLTLTRNIGHLNNTSVLFEEAYIEESETTASLIPGFIGPRPNAFMRVPQEQFSSFVEQLSNIESEQDYVALFDTYGIRRTNPVFWSRYDEFLYGMQNFSPLDYGVLDLNKLENR